MQRESRVRRIKTILKVAELTRPNIKEIHIFDFDQTLFRSPHPPDDEKDWWTNIKSLSPPCVPLEPDESWWNNEVVLAAKEAINKKILIA